jgi:deoxyhypusine synthase
MTLVVDRLQDDGTGNSDAVQNIIDGRAKAWVHGNNNAAIQKSFNVSSGTDNGVGDYIYDFTNNMDDSDSAFPASGRTNAPVMCTALDDGSTGVDVFINDESGSAEDRFHSVAAFGTLA